MESWKEKLINEYKELCERHDKLAKFLAEAERTGEWTCKESKTLLEIQYHTMTSYRNILKERLDINGLKAE